MTGTEDKTLAALREISARLDRVDETLDAMNKSLQFLCQCEEENRKEKLRKEAAMQENIEAMKKEAAKRREEFAKKFDTPILK